MLLKLNLGMSICLNSMMTKNSIMIAILFFEMFDGKKIAVLRTAPLIQAGSFYTAMIPTESPLEK